MELLKMLDMFPCTAGVDLFPCTVDIQDIVSFQNEMEHAKLWFKALGELGGTAENLLHAAEGENAE